MNNVVHGIPLRSSPCISRRTCLAIGWPFANVKSWNWCLGRTHQRQE